MVGAVLEGAGHRVAADQIFRLKVRAVGRKDELSLCLGSGWTVFERLECLRDLSCLAGQDVDFFGLENAAEIGLVVRPCAKTLDRRIVVPECLKEGIREIRGVEGLLREFGNGFLNLNCVQDYLFPLPHR